MGTVLLLCLLFWASPCSPTIPLYLGGFFPLHLQYMAQLLDSANLAVEHVNDNDDVLFDYELILLFNNTQGTTGVAMDALFYQLFNPPTKIMFVGPMMSSNAEVTAELTGLWNIVQVSYAGSAPSLSNRVKYPYYFRTLPAMDGFNAAILAFIKTFNWYRIGIIYEPAEPYTSTIHDLLLRVSHANITIACIESIPDDPAQRIIHLKNKDARIIIGIFSPEMGANIFCEAYKHGIYGPKYVWIILGIFGPEWWIRDADLLDCTTDEMNAAVRGYFAISWATWSLDTGPTISGKGPVAFTEGGDRKGVLAIEQNIDSVEVEIGRYYADSDDIVWSFTADEIWQTHGGQPPADEDTTVTTVYHITVSTSASYIMSILSVCGVLTAMGFLVFNCTNRKKRVIKMSSPNINNVMVCGCVLTYSSVVCFVLDRGLLSRDGFLHVCRARPWILSLGFTLAYGAMFSKTWRVYTVFTNKTPKRKAVKDQQLFTMLAVMVAIDIAILVAWQLVHPLIIIETEVNTVVRETDDTVWNDVYIIQSCSTINSRNFIIVSYTYKGLLLIFGTFLTWQIRSVTIPGLNDSKYVGLSLYSVVIISVIGVPISLVLEENVNALSIIISAFILFCTTMTLLLVFVPKVMAVRRGDDGMGAAVNDASILDDETTQNSQRRVNTVATMTTE
uniref:Gamma-aminobutyric acid type B receptor subunit 2-like n=1 Tax=Saccoglossus kowalevskii TaxID=10224 RepID=A0ABM0LV31_SACKO|nr:PREDICTED: gamma-aminobutyric acid type B receptor subunit 2-like [Saccoglossus kowalevskii]